VLLYHLLDTCGRVAWAIKCLPGTHIHLLQVLHGTANKRLMRGILWKNVNDKE